jgi:FkbM family methyltransferase
MEGIVSVETKLKKIPLLFRSQEFREKQYKKFVLSLFQRRFGNIRYLGIENDNQVIFTFTQDKYLTRNLALNAHPTRENLVVAVALCEQSGFDLTGIFFDVGANIGTETIYALKLNKFSKAVCFEPEPENLRLLRLNLIMNGVHDKVDIQPFAVSDRVGLVELEISAENPGDHRVSNPMASRGLPEMFNERNRKKFKVKCTTVDHMLADTDIRATDISLLWTDTQGHEGFVLSGATKILAHNIPVMLEFWPYGLIRNGSLELLCRLIQDNFRYCHTIADGVASELLTTDVLPAIVEKLKGSVMYEDLLLFK